MKTVFVLWGALVMSASVWATGVVRQPVLENELYVGCLVDGIFVDGLNLPPKNCVSDRGATATIQSPEFAYSAIRAAQSIQNLNWGSSENNEFRVEREDYKDDGVHISGDYLVTVTTAGQELGISYHVTVFEGAVTNLQLFCDRCD